MFRKLAVMLTCVSIGYLTSGEDVKSRQLTKEESTLRVWDAARLGAGFTMHR